MKISKQQLKSLVESVVKEQFEFESSASLIEDEMKKHLMEMYKIGKKNGLSHEDTMRAIVRLIDDMTPSGITHFL